MSLFLFVFLVSVGPRNKFPDVGLLVLSLRVPCGSDVEPEEELVDNPGTAIGTLFSVLHWILLPFLTRCGF